ncbi:MAG: carbamoyltransferase [Planctomycetota bacterium]|jgi:carbamoyltransferase|nr:carbamoyltransferase [Planctomycetota bacterium]
MKILGLSGAVGHDPSAALLCDGKLVAAVEEERFNRQKHAKNMQPREAALYCLEAAGVAPEEIDLVAYPFAPVSFFHPGRWHYAKRHLYAPDRALRAIVNGNRHFRRNRRNVSRMLEEIGIDVSDRAEFVPVEHHLTHASCAYHYSGFEEAAVLSVDGVGEYSTTWLGHGKGGNLHKIKEFHSPDSLGGFYGAVTEYLGFRMLNGEFKVMGMACYGDPDRFDLSSLITYGPDGYRLNTRYVNCVGFRRFRQKGIGRWFSKKLADLWGPPREGDEADEPYIHIAASVQKVLEEAVLALVRGQLKDVLDRCGNLCLAGGVALNVKMNQRLLAEPNVERIFIFPAAGDAGTAVGAASYVAHQRGEIVEPLQHVYLGPEYSDEEIEAALKERGVEYTRPEHYEQEVSDALARGEVVAWFQGRMEFGPRALGNRSILGNPAFPGVSDKVNLQIKYRERWRPFCPVVLDEAAESFLGTDHPSPYMTLTFDVSKEWAEKVPEIVHVDGTTRPQVVSAATNPKLHRMISLFRDKTGIPLLLNTSLNRRGEPMVCSPHDALEMFYGSDLELLAIGPFLVPK